MGRQPIELPEDFIKLAGDFVNKIPLVLVKVFGIIKDKFHIFEPRSKSRSDKNKKEMKKKNRKSNTTPSSNNPKHRSRLCVPDDADPYTFHAQMNKTTLKGLPYQKPGRKPNSKVVDGKVVMPNNSAPLENLKPVGAASMMAQGSSETNMSVVDKQELVVLKADNQR